MHPARHRAEVKRAPGRRGNGAVRRACWTRDIPSALHARGDRVAVLDRARPVLAFETVVRTRAARSGCAHGAGRCRPPTAAASTAAASTAAASTAAASTAAASTAAASTAAASTAAASTAAAATAAVAPAAAASTAAAATAVATAAGASTAAASTAAGTAAAAARAAAASTAANTAAAAPSPTLVATAAAAATASTAATAARASTVDRAHRECLATTSKRDRGDRNSSDNRLGCGGHALRIQRRASQLPFGRRRVCPPLAKPVVGGRLYAGARHQHRKRAAGRSPPTSGRPHPSDAAAVTRGLRATEKAAHVPPISRAFPLASRRARGTHRPL